MNRAVKVAISLPAETLAAVETFRKRTGRSRSAVFTEAVEALLAPHRIDERDRRYVEAYLLHPARQEDVGAVASAAVAAWEPWE